MPQLHRRHSVFEEGMDGRADDGRSVIRRIQEDGTCWCGGDTWQGQAVMRISVSCWATTEHDVEQSRNAYNHIAAHKRNRQRA
ncbi:MAG TPA: hypothetical protein ENO23_06975 [Alphaproteobacteria bacterium]|nr:hypothetical protein [Alphaproteobacteria bacterium]